MIKPKQKKCKGTGIAKNNGCKKVEFLYKYGLCHKCFHDFLKTDLGQQLISKYALKASKQYSQKDKEELIAKRKKEAFNKKNNQYELMSNDKFRAQILQPVINHIARLIDYGLPCIATQTFGQINGGHYYSVGSNRTISLNLHNIHRQSVHSNKWKGGDELNYRNGLINDYGYNYLEFIESLQQTPTLHLTKEDLKQIHTTAKLIVKELKQFIKTLQKPITPTQRIYLRNIYNKQLNIYPQQFIHYTINTLKENMPITKQAHIGKETHRYLLDEHGIYEK